MYSEILDAQFTGKTLYCNHFLTDIISAACTNIVTETDTIYNTLKNCIYNASLNEYSGMLENAYKKLNRLESFKVAIKNYNTFITSFENSVNRRIEDVRLELRVKDDDDVFLVNAMNGFDQFIQDSWTDEEKYAYMDIYYHVCSNLGEESAIRAMELLEIDENGRYAFQDEFKFRTYTEEDVIIVTEVYAYSAEQLEKMDGSISYEIGKGICEAYLSSLYTFYFILLNGDKEKILHYIIENGYYDGITSSSTYLDYSYLVLDHDLINIIENSNILDESSLGFRMYNEALLNGKDARCIKNLYYKQEIEDDPIMMYNKHGSDSCNQSARIIYDHFSEKQAMNVNISFEDGMAILTFDACPDASGRDRFDSSHTRVAMSNNMIMNRIKSNDDLHEAISEKEFTRAELITMYSNIHFMNEVQFIDGCLVSDYNTVFWIDPSTFSDSMDESIYTLLNHYEVTDNYTELQQMADSLVGERYYVTGEFLDYKNQIMDYFIEIFETKKDDYKQATEYTNINSVKQNGEACDNVYSQLELWKALRELSSNPDIKISEHEWGTEWRSEGAIHIFALNQTKNGDYCIQFTVDNPDYVVDQDGMTSVFSIVTGKSYGEDADIRYAQMDIAKLEEQKSQIALNAVKSTLISIIDDFVPVSGLSDAYNLLNAYIESDGVEFLNSIGEFESNVDYENYVQKFIADYEEKAGVSFARDEVATIFGAISEYYECEKQISEIEHREAVKQEGFVAGMHVYEFHMSDVIAADLVQNNEVYVSGSFSAVNEDSKKFIFLYEEESTINSTYAISRLKTEGLAAYLSDIGKSDEEIAKEINDIESKGNTSYKDLVYGVNSLQKSDQNYEEKKMNVLTMSDMELYENLATISEQLGLDKTDIYNWIRMGGFE